MKLSPRFTEALTYAVGLHRDQQRKVSGSPYVAHLLRVAGIVLEHGADENEAIAALLHDAVEDQGGQTVRDDIRRRFGNTIVEIVDGCTDTDQTPKPPWRPRKEAHLARLRHASASTRLVATADKLDNARALLFGYRTHGKSLWRHFRGGREGTLWYYRAAVEVLKQAGAGPLVDELDRTVSQLERVVLDESENST